MAISIHQIHPVFVGEVSGVDLRRPLSPVEVAAIEDGMDRYAVLIFHDQNITDEQQIAFSRNFGEIENSYGGTIAQPNDKRLHPLMNDVSNLGKDDRPLARDDRRRFPAQFPTPIGRPAGQRSYFLRLLLVEPSAHRRQPSCGACPAPASRQSGAHDALFDDCPTSPGRIAAICGNRHSRAASPPR